MRIINKLCNLTIIFSVTVLLVACDGGSSSGFTPQPELEQQTSFSSFVETQFELTADDTDPVPIKSQDFNFDSQDDPNAFDTLLE